MKSPCCCCCWCSDEHPVRHWPEKQGGTPSPSPFHNHMCQHVHHALSPPSCDVGASPCAWYAQPPVFSRIWCIPVQAAGRSEGYQWKNNRKLQQVCCTCDQGHLTCTWCWERAGLKIEKRWNQRHPNRQQWRKVVEPAKVEVKVC